MSIRESCGSVTEANPYLRACLRRGGQAEEDSETRGAGPAGDHRFAADGASGDHVGPALVLVACQVPDQLAVDVDGDRAGVVRIVRLGYERCQPLDTNLLVARARRELQQSVLVVRRADDTHEFVALEHERVAHRC